MQTLSFEEGLELLLIKEKRYQRDAYLFVRDSLDHTRKLVEKELREARSQKRTESVEQHVTGQQLLEGARELALQCFGPMAQMVLEEWGIRSCRDIGEIVFIMVDHKLFKKTERDSRTDFEGGYDFYDAFRKPFLPKSKLGLTKTAPKEAKA